MARIRSVAIDWSGAVKPRGKLALAEASGGELLRLDVLDTREQALAAIGEYRSGRDPVVVGIDFSFSLPRWFTKHLRVADAFALWTRVETEGEQWLRDCAWPFWGRPGVKKPELAAHLRATERYVGESLGLKPKSTFQIGGAGAVGTGSLRGMPYLARCREAGFSIWPFERATRHNVVEIYPRALTGAVVKSSLAARQDYLKRSQWQLSKTMFRAAVASEDTFDAAISALVLSAHADELGRLPRGNTTERLEGRIWTPNGSVRHGRP